MNYKIKVEGGFTGIPKEYEGEITLPQSEKEALIDSLLNMAPGNPKLRDSQRYHIMLNDRNGLYDGHFDETNLPNEIRSFIQRIVKRNTMP